ncbi:hypothetical protein K438DRAFT_1785881 [Mycena galopus ATCC 62051]|nr:hypothetical protein K438DRAFT_1785881 [Mycena galopus ATCC 62051]
MFPLKPFTLALLCFIVTLALGEVDSKPRGHTMGKRDDNLPARVPYVFPPPGTDPIADAIPTRRTNGLLLDLDGVLLNAPTILIVLFGPLAYAKAYLNPNDGINIYLRPPVPLLPRLSRHHGYDV